MLVVSFRVRQLGLSIHSLVKTGDLGKDDDSIVSSSLSWEEMKYEAKTVRPAVYAFHKSVPVPSLPRKHRRHAYQRGRSRILICYGVWVWVWVWVWHTKNLLYSIGKQLQSLYCNLV